MWKSTEWSAEQNRKPKNVPTKHMLRTAIESRNTENIVLALKTENRRKVHEVVTMIHQHLDMTKHELDVRQAEDFFEFLIKVHKESKMENISGIPITEIEGLIDEFQYKMRPIDFAEFMLENGRWIENAFDLKLFPTYRAVYFFGEMNMFQKLSWDSLIKVRNNYFQS